MIERYSSHDPIRTTRYGVPLLLGEAMVNSMWFIERSPAVGPCKDLLHWPNRIRIHDDHPRLAQFHRLRKRATKFFSRSHLFRLKAERARDPNKVRTPKIDPD